MTEAEWLICRDPDRMADFLKGKSCESLRRWRLFAVACCDRTWSSIQAEYWEVVVDVFERCADGLATPEEWNAALTEAYIHEFGSAEAAAEGIGYDDDAVGIALTMADTQAMNCPYATSEKDRRTPQEEKAAQAELLRDVFTPFQSVPFDDTWRAPIVVRLAESIYAHRTFDRLPILADALEEAGCTDAVILDHCRGPGPHVRGCWVVDLILGKE